MDRKLRVLIVVLVLIGWYQTGQAQYRHQPTKPNISSILAAPQRALFSGLLNPNKLHMRHSFSMSFGMGSGQSLMLNSYLNTIDYQISEKLWLRANLGIMSSPYNSLGKDFYLNKPRFFGGAQLHYQLSENANIMVEFSNTPYYYYPMFGRFSAFEQ